MNRARSSATAAVLLVSAAVLAACGGGASASSAISTTHATASRSASSAGAGTTAQRSDRVDNTDYCVQEAFSGPVADRFGAQNVDQAYCELVNFALKSSWTRLTLRAPNGPHRPEEFTFVHPYMTSTLQVKWDDLVRKALAGDEQSKNAVWALTFYEDGKPGPVVMQDRPDFVFSKAAGPAALDWDQRGPANHPERLVIKFTAEAQLHVLVNGKPNTVRQQKTVSYAVIPSGNSDIPWLIDDYQGTFQNDAPKPES